MDQQLTSGENKKQEENEKQEQLLRLRHSEQLVWP